MSMKPTRSQQQKLAFCVLHSNEPARLDQLLALLFPDFSRSQLQRWIKSGQVAVDDKKLRPRDPMSGGEVILIEVPEPVQPEWEAQPMALDLVFEDDEILVLNKPAGLVVHPGAGNPDSTLLNALISHAPQLRSLPRAGIVHRLDKDTSGLMVVAKTERARLNLIEQLSSRELHREYKTVVMGVMISGGTVDAPIGRHRQDRKRMAITEHGKPAISHYRVATRYRAHTLVDVTLATGRTHQIRVHMAYIHFPVVGDPVYGGRLKLPKNCSETLKLALRGFHRQALHAGRLGLMHPVTGEELSWQCELPADMLSLIEALAQDTSLHESYQR
ncbi:MAG: 23S rRNA pseudouridine(1911/1915/1917) synthase RluD [Acidiferrobacterales bacterium]